MKPNPFSAFILAALLLLTNAHLLFAQEEKIEAELANPNLKMTTTTVPIEGVYEYAVIKGQFPRKTGGGLLTSGKWNTRLLSKLESAQKAGDEGWVTLDNHKITLIPGSYMVKAYAANYSIAYNQLRLQAIDEGRTEIAGMSSFSRVSSQVNTAYLSGIFQISVNTVYELQHNVQTKNDNGGGIPTSTHIPNVGNIDEVYTVIEIVKLN